MPLKSPFSGGFFACDLLAHSHIFVVVHCILSYYDTIYVYVIHQLSAIYSFTIVYRYIVYVMRYLQSVIRTVVLPLWYDTFTAIYVMRLEVICK